MTSAIFQTHGHSLKDVGQILNHWYSEQLKMFSTLYFKISSLMDSVFFFPPPFSLCMSVGKSHKWHLFPLLLRILVWRVLDSVFRFVGYTWSDSFTNVCVMVCFIPEERKKENPLLFLISYFLQFQKIIMFIKIF